MDSSGVRHDTPFSPNEKYLIADMEKIYADRSEAKQTSNLEHSQGHVMYVSLL